MAKRSKTQARRNGGGGIPGWIWLLVGLLGGLVVAAVLFLQGRLDGIDTRLPQPNPAAQAQASSEEPVAQDATPAPRKPKYDFYTVLPEKEVLIPDAELTAQAQAEAAAPADPAAVPANADQVRYVIQAGAFRNAGDAEALKARIALTGEVARVESAVINGATIYRVRLGPYPTARTLAAAKDALASHGIEAVALRER